MCDFLERSEASPVRRYTLPGGDIDGVFDLRAVFQQDFRSLSLVGMPRLLMPRKGRYGLIDYEKIFCADLKSGNDIFDMRGIDREQGCLVVVRPDQHVANVLPLSSTLELAAFFEPFMNPAG